jgi:hypothetical protein
MILKTPTIRLSVYIIIHIFANFLMGYCLQAKFKILNFSAIRPKLMHSLRKCHQAIVLFILLAIACYLQKIAGEFRCRRRVWRACIYRTSRWT